MSATVNGSTEPKELWRPSSPETTQIHHFKTKINQKYGLSLDTYHDLWQWSVSELAAFWEEVWHYTGVKAKEPYTKVLDPSSKNLFPKPKFFEGARLNFAENLLFPPSSPADDAVAVIAATEESRQFVKWGELRERVRQCANALRESGVRVGDRVAGFIGNHADAVIAMLAATSIGALWTGISPDTGVHAVLERLRQVEPKVLFADNASLYNGKVHSTGPKVEEIVAELPCLEYVVIIPSIASVEVNLARVTPKNGQALFLADFTGRVNQSAPLQFEYLDPDHPIYILYSSGTTGAPKPIVHGALGTLLQHKKEHVLHCDIRPGDRLFYYTTTTWMMWHWLVSGLASGATIVVYDGSPFRPFDPEGGKGEMAMARLIEELGITQFGTSAKYLSMIEQAGLNPRQHPHRPVTLRTLRAIFSTAAPLAPSTFEYVYSSFHPDVMLGSITGGTDIISLFGASCPILPVYRGEIQCRGLGMAVASYDYSGKDITSTGEPGDLVCTKPFPAQPVMFWPPGPVGAEKYRKSYFDTFGPSTWHHGDYVRINPDTGGLVMLGRSDGVLKPAGVRFGSAEIYNVILKHFASEIEDSLCIGRRREGIDTDETVVLFVKLAGDPTPTTISEDLVTRIKAAIRTELSARHVPGIIDACPEIPVTANGKKVENAVKQILCGLQIKTAASVANAACLDWYRDWAKRHE